MTQAAADVPSAWNTAVLAGLTYHVTVRRVREDLAWARDHGLSVDEIADAAQLPQEFVTDLLAGDD